MLMLLLLTLFSFCGLLRRRRPRRLSRQQYFNLFNRSCCPDVICKLAHSAYVVALVSLFSSIPGCKHTFQTVELNDVIYGTRILEIRYRWRTTAIQLKWSQHSGAQRSTRSFRHYEYAISCYLFFASFSPASILFEPTKTTKRIREKRMHFLNCRLFPFVSFWFTAVCSQLKSQKMTTTAPRWTTATVLAAAAILLLVIEARPNQVMTPGEHSPNSPFVRRRSSGITRRSTTTPDILRQHLKQVPSLTKPRTIWPTYPVLV